VDLEPHEAVVVGVLLDVLGRGVFLAPRGGEVPEPCAGTRPRVPGAIDAGKRDERAADAHSRDGVVGLEVTPLALAGEDDGTDHTGLVHLAFQGLRVAGLAVGPPGLVGFQPDVRVHHAEPVLQFQHLAGEWSGPVITIVTVPATRTSRRKFGMRDEKWIGISTQDTTRARISL